jgi:hypothetical protein
MVIEITHKVFANRRGRILPPKREGDLISGDGAELNPSISAKTSSQAQISFVGTGRGEE